jgi:thiamine biosynthesis protein ThiI
MFERVCLVHYHEIGLKGRNRAAFERQLQANLDAVLAGLGTHPAERIASRLLVRPGDGEDVFDICERVSLVPGVNSCAPAFRTARDLGDIGRAALLALGEGGGDASTFAIDARRSNTDFAISSMDMNRQLGDLVRHETELTVDLDAPDVTVWIEVVQGDAYVYAVKGRGIGGLPVGTAGKVVGLLSAGIDSPVACWRMMRRGAVVVGVHFSGVPHTSDASERLVTEIGSVLERSGGLGRIYMVPFGELQKEISLATPPDLRVLLYRRLMVRVAERIAGVEGAKALVTGESLGQVASQTLENMSVVGEAATLLALRPLVGSDKVEIIDQARSIGTYEISTQPHDDCCTLFMPRNPETHAKPEQVFAAESQLDITRMVDDAIGHVSWREFACNRYRAPRAWPSHDGVATEADESPQGVSDRGDES